MRDFAFQEFSAPFPLLKLVILLLQAIDLVEGGGIGPHTLHSATRLNGGKRRSLKQGGGEIDQSIARIGDDAMADTAQDEENGA